MIDLNSLLFLFYNISKNVFCIMKKEDLYNKIINNVAKEVKKALNEGLPSENTEQYEKTIMNESLKSARLKYLGRISLEDFNSLQKLDNSKSYKWIEKMCQLYTEGHTIEQISKVFDEYSRYYIFMENKDITHKSYDEIMHDISNAKICAENTNKQKRSREKERNKIYDNNGIIIYDIKNYADIKLKAKSCKLCIVGNEEMFDGYTLTGHKFLMIYNNNVKFDNDLSRICCDIYNDKIWMFDRNDIAFDMNDDADRSIILNAFGGVSIFNDVLKFIENTFYVRY